VRVLGIHDGHNASAALVEDGRVIAAVQEERLNREKNWFGFPSGSIAWVLRQGHVEPQDLDAVAMNGHHMLLNTSFNLHGFPIVNTPDDALDVLEGFGLKYLAMGNWLITKT